MLIVDSFELRNKDYLKKNILEQGHRDQMRTSIKIDDLLGGNIYHPYYEHERYGEELPLHWSLAKADFERKLKNLTHENCEIVDMWAIGYEGGQGCKPHNHRRNTYGAIYYLYGDVDAGNLEFPNKGITVQPKENRFVIFSGEWSHQVEPSIADEIDRVCIAMNVDVEGWVTPKGRNEK